MEVEWRDLYKQLTEQSKLLLPNQIAMVNDKRVMGMTLNEFKSMLRNNRDLEC